MDAFQKRDLEDFIYALEFLNADVNKQENSDLTVFQKILRTPNTTDYIEACIRNGADCYTVISL